MPHPNPSPSTDQWTFEVVRGVRPGQRYPLDEGAMILGNGAAPTHGSTFLDLADQEGPSPRKMAGRHAAVSQAGLGMWSVRDLETPGGTFVNNRRVLPGAVLPLAEGDVVQLGSVQLRLSRGGAVVPPAPVAGYPPGFLYQSSASGTTCRTWDDFLTFSAQRWDELRDDVASGRIAAFVASVGRPDLAPPATRVSLNADQADERLDAWIARLPTRSPAAPELDVYPLRLTVSVPAGGVAVVRKVRIANVGYRLLRARVRLEGAVGATFTLGPGIADREIVVRDSADIPIEVAVPDPFVGPAAAQVVISGGGAEKRVAIEVERKDASARSDPSGVGPQPTPDPVAIPGLLVAFLAMPIGKRVMIAALVGVAARLLVGVAGGAIGADAMAASGPDVPQLAGVVLAFGLTGAIIGAWRMARRVGRGDAIPGAIAGAGLGTLLAAVVVALCRAVEPGLGPLAASPVVVCGLWGTIGGVLALLTPRSTRAIEEPAR